MGLGWRCEFAKGPLELSHATVYGARLIRYREGMNVDRARIGGSEWAKGQKRFRGGYYDQIRYV